MSQKVLLLGANGETGHWILDGLLDDGSFVAAPHHRVNDCYTNTK